MSTQKSAQRLAKILGDINVVNARLRETVTDTPTVAWQKLDESHRIIIQMANDMKVLKRLFVKGF